jgi:adenine-specific DNA-methyltransferase
MNKKPVTRPNSQKPKTPANSKADGKAEIIANLEKRVADKILEPSNFELLRKLVQNADSLDEAIKIAELGTTYKRTGFHFDKRLEKESDDIAYFKKNKKLSFVTDKNALTHKLIIGDNYPALLNLLVEYRGRVDVIYIDPPYGKDNMGEFAETNYENAITRDNLLSMLYPRLWLAQRLLSVSGVILCSIDDRNQAYVRGLFDEVFGENKFIASFPRVTKQSGKTTDAVAKNHDYVLMYSKANSVEFNLEKHDDDGYSNKDEYFEERGFYKLSQPLDYDTLGYIASLDYPIKIDGKTYYAGGSFDDYKKRHAERPKNGARWRWSKELFDFGYENGFVVVRQSKNGTRIYTKTYQKATIVKPDGNYEIITIDRTKNLSTLKFVDNAYSNDNAKKNIDSVLEKGVFDYSKPTKLIKDLCSFCAGEDAVILDFFAGSGTTGQAVLELNKDDGDKGKRQFILVTNNENDIAENVTSKRLKRVMTGKCYDGANDFEWAKKNEPLGGNLLVLDVAKVANSESTNGKTPFDVIDETLYGLEEFKTVKGKTEWVCANFEITQKELKEK